VVEHCARVGEVMGSNTVQPSFFSGFDFTTASVMSSVKLSSMVTRAIQAVLNEQMLTDNRGFIC